MVEQIPLSEFIASNVSQLAPTELAIGDGLTDHLVQSLDLDAVDLAVVVDVDPEEPVAKIEGGNIFLRFNGRYRTPKFDKGGAKVDLDGNAWRDLTKTYFQDNEIQYAFDDTSNDLIKFTALVPCMTVPESAPEDSETEQPAEEEAPAEEAPEEKAPKEEAPAEEESTDEFEKALNE